MKPTALFCIIAPIIWIGLKPIVNNDTFLKELPFYEVTYEFKLKGEKDEFRVHSFIPENDFRQIVELDQMYLLNVESDWTRENHKVTWRGKLSGDTTLVTSFYVQPRAVQFQFEELDILEIETENFDKYLSPTEVIQVQHPDIQQLLFNLNSNGSTDAKVLAQSFFEYVDAIPSAKISTLTDAVTCLQNQLCSCNGKSRLLVALFRSQNIPARMVGGLILEDTSKRTSHAWVEAYIGNQWVPFDALNGHFAGLPAHYLKLYMGDEFLIRRNTGYDFDYMYHIREVNEHQAGFLDIFSLDELFNDNSLPVQPLLFLLLLPLGALVVAIFKNVIGVQTFGVFLPALIGFAFIEMGILAGIIFFTGVIILISILGVPLGRWQLLYTPKIVILLSAVTIFCLISIRLFQQYGWVDPSAALLFPVIILTMVADKFARKVEEESLKKALSVYAQTILVTIFCSWILGSLLIQSLFIQHPELLISIIGVGLFLGKWIGLRVSEYSRFGALQKVEA
ncbi:MAG: 7TM domain-containing protein [Balneolaceae bacterium]